MDVFLANRANFNFCLKPVAQPVNALFDNSFRCRCTCRDEYRLIALEPGWIDVRWPVDQPCRNSRVMSQLTQSLAIGTVLAPQHEAQIGFGRQFSNGVLPVLCCIADVIFGRIHESGETLAQSVDNPVRVIH